MFDPKAAARTAKLVRLRPLLPHLEGLITGMEQQDTAAVTAALTDLSQDPQATPELQQGAQWLLKQVRP